VDPTAQLSPGTPKAPVTHASTGPSTVRTATPLAAALFGAPIAEAAATDLQVFRSTSLQGVPPSGVGLSTSFEPSVSNHGNTVFYTGNYFAAPSADGGSTFTYVNPGQALPPGPSGQPWCCDQVTIYDPNYNLLIWEVEYQRDAAGNNVQRLAIPIDQSNLATTGWSYWDISAQTLGFASGYWLDYPKLALSANNLFMTTNVCLTGGGCNNTVMIGIPLSSLAQRAPNVYWYTDSGIGFGPTSGVQTQMSKMYFARHLNTTTLRIYTWTEGSGVITWADVGHSAYNPPPSKCPSPDATSGNPHNMCGNDNDWIKGGWVENGKVGFFWDANNGTAGLGTFNYPYIHAVEVNQTDMSLNTQPIIYSDSNAWAWGSVAVSNLGGLGMSAQWSAPSYAPSSNVLLRDDVTANNCGILCWQAGYVQNGSNGPANNAWGDYLTVRVASGSSNTWVGTSYTLQCSPPSDPCTVVEPRFIWFGRQRDLTPTP
jgi:hypothetical protein